MGGSAIHGIEMVWYALGGVRHSIRHGVLALLRSSYGWTALGSKALCSPPAWVNGLNTHER